MRFFFAMIGILFELLVVAAACFVLNCVVYPDFFEYSMSFVTDELGTNLGRLRLAGGAAVIVILFVFRFYFLVFGRKDPVFEVRRSEKGTLTVSMSTLRRLVEGIAGDMAPPAGVRNMKIVQNDDGLHIRMQISLDMSKCNLGEYIGNLNETIRSYFKESLGVPVTAIDVQASTAMPENAHLPIAPPEHNT